jgi:YHS domain-containing protein
MRLLILGKARHWVMDTSIADPVCWMDVARKSIAGKSENNRKTYYFCSPGCKETFDSDPELYVDESNETKQKLSIGEISQG